MAVGAPLPAAAARWGSSASAASHSAAAVSWEARCRLYVWGIVWGVVSCLRTGKVSENIHSIIL